jgi:hypothetical protein
MIDDDLLGGSHGNGDGQIDFGETIELTLALQNAGHLDAYGVTAELISASPYVDLPVNLTAFGSIPAGETVMCDPPLIFHVAPDVPNGEILEFTLVASEEPGGHYLRLPVLAPEYLVGIIEIDDASGNGNGMPDPGETVTVTLAVTNTGGSQAPDLQAVLASNSPCFVPDPTPHTLGTISVGETVVAAGFAIDITPECLGLFADYLLLDLSGANDYAMTYPVVFCTGQIFADDLELDAVSWHHYQGPGDWLDEWHRETYRNHTPGGQTSWKVGGPGGANYSNLVHGMLETADMVLPAQARLEFWHWIDAQAGAVPPQCMDGGLLEISTDGGASWTQLTPEGDYPYQTRPTTIPGPFPWGTPVWSGQHDWSEVGVDLGEYEGLARFRWVFGSDGVGTFEGWYIDDVRVGTGWPSAAPADGNVWGERVELFPVCPNPVSGSGLAAGSGSQVTLRFALARSMQGELALFDAAGRLRRVLATGELSAGEHRIAWDGRDDAGRAVAAGRYFLRLAGDRGSATTGVTIVR